VIATGGQAAERSQIMSTILIVDDEPGNRFLLRACLEGKGRTILEVASGASALRAVDRQDVDLVLLDVMMPGMDGFETARRIKEKAGESFLPVVLVTALGDQESRLSGLQAGADDFLTKPIDDHELTTRVRNLLSLRKKELTLRKRNLKMLELMRFREEMSALLVHDLKTPISIVDLSLDFVQRQLLDPEPQVSDALMDARRATERTRRIVSNMLDLVRLETHRLVLHRELARPADVLSAVAEGRASLARKHTVSVELETDHDLEVDVDVDLFTRVIENILDNSLQHVPDGGHILLRAEAQGSSAAMLIGNDGPPVPPALRQAIFEKFICEERASTRLNLGLGLYFCRLAMEAHGGRIWVSDEPMPAVFGIELPLAGQLHAR
jgi:two-component system, sensor histidine kinase and response regulator